MAKWCARIALVAMSTAGPRDRGDAAGVTAPVCQRQWSTVRRLVSSVLGSSVRRALPGFCRAGPCVIRGWTW